MHSGDLYVCLEKEIQEERAIYSIFGGIGKGYICLYEWGLYCVFSKGKFLKLSDHMLFERDVWL